MPGEQERTRLVFRLVVSVLLLLPLLGNLLAIAVGWHVFFLDDARTQFIWGTLALLWGLWPQCRLRLSATAIVTWGAALCALAVYGLSVRNTFFQPQSLNGVLPVYYLQAGVLVSLVLVGRLLVTLWQR
ncbi:MAG: hypothetical protein ACM3XM_05810 [Mycobacterium leprae]